MKAIFKHLKILAMDQIITVWILRFIKNVAYMPVGRLTREVLGSHARPVGPPKRGPKEMSTRQSYVRALNAAGLLDSS
jgi:hypothetical protein